MDRVTTEVLVGKAKGGDADAWAQILERYYRGWLAKYHGTLDTVVRKLYDTQDLVQSAIGDAMVDISALRNDAAFFTWVTSIIRHKLAKSRRRLVRETDLSRCNDVDHGQAPPEDSVQTLDSYLQTLETILDLFPEHTEAMAAVVMRFQEGCDMEEMTTRFQRPRRTVYRWLAEGTELLRGRLSS